MKNLIPKWLLPHLFRITKVRDERERGMFHGLWTAVWEEEGYAHADEPLHKIEFHYALFDSQSTDLILWVLGLVPIGTMRIIHWGPQGLPVLNDFEVEERWRKEIEERREGLVEFTLLTLQKQWRGLKHAPSFILMREAYRRVKCEKRGVLIAADERLFHLFQRIKMPFVQVGPSKFYEGSITIPAFLPVPEAEEEFRAANPPLANFFLS